MNELHEIKQGIQIFNPVHEVYEAVADPAKMSNYFLESGSARLDSGNTVTWRFAEVNADFSIKVVEAIADKKLAYRWDNDGVETLCEITFRPTLEGAATVVEIKESEHDGGDKLINWLKGNSEGWSNFLTSLKAYCEYGINLRKDAFTYEK